MLKQYIVEQGQRAPLWRRDGRAIPIAGPKSVWAFGGRLEVIDQYLAGPEEYLVLHDFDGGTTHESGPTAVWFDPLRYQQIEVRPKIRLDANEAIVVYRPIGTRVERRVERGPALFMPVSDEWLHNFSWHGADPTNPRKKRASALRFTNLRVIPDQLYYDVENVRTADDALLTVQLMVFFELADIERMLDKTHDPIADFINATTADVIDFASALSFEKLKEQTERLNERETYTQLTKRAELIGYRITKIVYRGYEANDALQAMHDDAIESRTRLKLEAETERQAQDLADLKQTREGERDVLRRRLEAESLQHRNDLCAKEGEAHLALELRESEQALKIRRLDHDLELTRQTRLKEERLQHLGGLADLKVDVTRYLVAEYQHPDRVIRIDGDAAAQLHVHEKDT
ncbi:MAG: hypothetical protein SynsKO_09000 [Synoicihabitans sp.]